MKNFLCTVAFLLVASVGYSSHTNEGKPVKTAKIVAKTLIEAKSPKLVSTRYRVTCPAAQGGATTTFECDCNMAQAVAMAQAWCSNQ
jgi:hypothetical protein